MHKRLNRSRGSLKGGADMRGTTKQCVIWGPDPANGNWAFLIGVRVTTHHENRKYLKRSENTKVVKKKSGKAKCFMIRAEGTYKNSITAFVPCMTVDTVFHANCECIMRL